MEFQELGQAGQLNASRDCELLHRQPFIIIIIIIIRNATY
jgi:hypothetical protein